MGRSRLWSTGKVWVFGAFEPAQGLAHTHCAPSRTSLHFTAFLGQVAEGLAGGALILILDNLSITTPVVWHRCHKTLDARLWMLAHPRVRFLFLPTYMPWLNLTEPWWHRLLELPSPSLLLAQGRLTYETEHLGVKDVEAAAVRLDAFVEACGQTVYQDSRAAIYPLSCQERQRDPSSGG